MRITTPALVVLLCLGCTRPTARSSEGEVTSMSEGLGGGVLAYDVWVSANVVARELRAELSATTNGNAEGLSDPSTTTTVVFGIDDGIDDNEVTYVEASSPDGSRSAVELDVDFGTCSGPGFTLNTDDSCSLVFQFLAQAPVVRSGISATVRVSGFAADDWTGDPEAADYSVDLTDITADVIAQSR